MGNLLVKHGNDLINPVSGIVLDVTDLPEPSEYYKDMEVFLTKQKKTDDKWYPSNCIYHCTKLDDGTYEWKYAGGTPVFDTGFSLPADLTGTSKIFSVNETLVNVYKDAQYGEIVVRRGKDLRPIHCPICYPTIGDGSARFCASDGKGFMCPTWLDLSPKDKTLTVHQNDGEPLVKPSITWGTYAQSARGYTAQLYKNILHLSFFCKIGTSSQHQLLIKVDNYAPFKFLTGATTTGYMGLSASGGYRFLFESLDSGVSIYTDSGPGAGYYASSQITLRVRKV